MKALMIIPFFIVSLFFDNNNNLSGRWESKSETGTITGVVFKSDSIFEGYINKKPFVSGTYTYRAKDSIFSFVDNGCDGMRGIYKIRFNSTADSFRFEPVMDSCVQRKEGMQRLRMGKVK